MALHAVGRKASGIPAQGRERAQERLAQKLPALRKEQCRSPKLEGEAWVVRLKASHHLRRRKIS